MAVPASGTLSQLAIAQEALYGTYGSGTITGPISLYDMVNGGNTNGSGNSYPTVNTGCLPNPANRGSNQLTAVTDAMGAGSTTYYYNSNIGDASNLSVGDYLYTDSSLSTPATIIFGVQTGSSATTTICSAGTSISGLNSEGGAGQIQNLPSCS
tara:strand:+ start:512 stop:973 length:462 start_codon:yes stop_codon:yes gene_type:complete